MITTLSKEILLEAMKEAGWYFDDIDSTDEWLVFRGDYCTTMYFNSYNEVEDWLYGVVFDDPKVSHRVESILYPDKFND